MINMALSLQSGIMTNHEISGDGDTVSDNSAGAGLTMLAKLCDLGGCPTVYRTERDTLIVQGFTITGEAAGIDLPPGEQLVEIPVELLTAATRAGE